MEAEKRSKAKDLKNEMIIAEKDSALAENAKALAEKDSALAENQKTIAENEQRLAEQAKELEELRILFNKGKQ